MYIWNLEHFEVTKFVCYKARCFAWYGRKILWRKKIKIENYLGIKNKILWLTKRSWLLGPIIVQFTWYYKRYICNLCHSCGFNYKQRVNASCSPTMAFTGKFVNFCISCYLNVPNIFMKVIHLQYIIRIQPEELQASKTFFWPKIPLLYKKLCHYEVLTKVHFQTL